MVIKSKHLLWLSLFSLTACTATAIMPTKISDVYVADFTSDNIETCSPDDVDLSNQQAKEYFSRASQVTHKIIHDHYNVAPCYIEGTLQHKGETCNWKIRAGATGQIQCDNNVTHFVCETCVDLFEPSN